MKNPASFSQLVEVFEGELCNTKKYLLILTQNNSNVDSSSKTSCGGMGSYGSGRVGSSIITAVLPGARAIGTLR